MKDVSIILVSHRQEDYLSKCLHSIFRHPRKVDFEVIVVDNLPDGACRELCERYFPEVRLIENKRPLAYSQNNNLGIKNSQGRYVLILNPDTLLLEGALSKLVEFMDKTPEAGCCGAKLLFPDGRLQFSCRRYPSLKSVLLRRPPLRSLLPARGFHQRYLMQDWDHDSVRMVDWLLGACLMFRRETLDAVGTFDEKMPWYCEDVDICYRINELSPWKVFYVPDAQVVHVHQNEVFGQIISRKVVKAVWSVVYFFLKKHLLYRLSGFRRKAASKGFQHPFGTG